MNSMNIQPTNSISYKGYDARPLKGFMMSSNCHGIAKEMQAIGEKEGFKLYSAFTLKKGGTGEFLPRYTRATEGLWAQDYWMIVKDKLLTKFCDNRSAFIKNFFNLKYDFTESVVRENEKLKFLNKKLQPPTLKDDVSIEEQIFDEELDLRYAQSIAHIPGGNIYLVKNVNKDEALVGKYELQNYSTDEIAGMYCADTVIPIPQMDYHVDLFIRPLDNKRILLTDDKLTYEILKKHSSKLAEPFKKLSEQNRLPKADDVAKVLEENSYEVIRVPGRIYDKGVMKENGEFYLKHYCNYMNANVIKNPDGDLVYITNKSNINKLVGFDFEKEFIESISPYIKKEKVYFISGEDNFVGEEMLPNCLGGIHCTCTEVP